MLRTIAAAGFAAMLTAASFAETAEKPMAEATKSEAPTRRQYTYTWMFSDTDAMAPRGGSTRGPAVALDRSLSPAFAALQATDLSDKERDRRAILAMVGDYRTTFDFIETVGLTPGYEPQRPYRSWGTERVYLVSDEPDLISLQHIIVMHFLQDDGSVSEPMVVKHWRQDWRYEDREIHGYVARNSFEKTLLSEEEASGAWSQTVYQVDDSPRYEAYGRWVHTDGASFWESADMRRPLPRREFSVRDDYHALYGSHRITVYPTGWSQEEDALKLVLDENDQPRAKQPYLAREAGLSRYERLQDYDFAAGDEYWERTGPFWAAVRDYWDALYASNDRFAFEKTVDGEPMFMKLFAMAEESYSDAAARETALEEALAPYRLGE